VILFFLIDQADEFTRFGESTLFVFGKYHIPVHGDIHDTVSARDQRCIDFETTFYLFCQTDSSRFVVSSRAIGDGYFQGMRLLSSFWWFSVYSSNGYFMINIRFWNFGNLARRTARVAQMPVEVPACSEPMGCALTTRPVSPEIAISILIFPPLPPPHFLTVGPTADIAFRTCALLGTSGVVEGTGTAVATGLLWETAGLLGLEDPSNESSLSFSFSGFDWVPTGAISYGEGGILSVFSTSC
jgi:hypothetical protein